MCSFIFILRFPNHQIAKLTIVLFVFSLQVVSTCVGGIPEVLPSNLINLAEPSIKCMYFFPMNVNLGILFLQCNWAN